jgi:hypothetical protein
MIATHSHIVAIRHNGEITGHQLRINGGGTGMSKFFAASKHGGPLKSERAAKLAAKEMGLPKPKPRGGSRVGRVLSSSVTNTAGIRFSWVHYESGPVLRVIATWTDKTGLSHHTSYSVQRNGLEGAMDKAIKARKRSGGPAPDKEALMKLLKREFRTKAQMMA